MSTKATVMKAIRSYCVETCCAGSEEYVRECPGNSEIVGVFCPLHPYRFSSDPSPSVLRTKHPVENVRKKTF